MTIFASSNYKQILWHMHQLHGQIQMAYTTHHSDQDSEMSVMISNLELIA